MIVNCPKCGSTNVQHRGYSDDRTKRRYECQENHDEYVDENGFDYRWFRLPIESKQSYGKAPRILFWDIENSGMNIENVWNLWEPRINYSQIKGHSFLLGWAGKFLYEDTIYSDVVTSREAKNRDDKRITQSLWKILDSADIIIAHNGDGHDVPKSNTRFLYHGMTPPMYDRTIDTYKVAKNTFSFPSNSLDNINDYLGLSKKIHNEPGLFDRCVAGNTEDLKKLELYNRQDIVCLEEVYLYKLRPWIKNHPNWMVYSESDGSCCSYCGKQNLVWRDDKLYKGVYKIAKCIDCGATVRSNKNQMDKLKKKEMVYPR
jgi:DNA polymerase III epsilon subunit-like protein